MIAHIQEPALFNGTLRFNLDPDSRHSDSRIWDVLRTCGLVDFVRQFPEGLEFVVDADGTALSEGERQTICCIRGMLSSVLVYPYTLQYANDHDGDDANLSPPPLLPTSPPLQATPSW